MRSPFTSIPGACTTRAATLFLAVVALATGCATAQPKTNYVWPVPPETPRIRYLRSFASTDDLKPSFGRKLLNAIFPHDARAKLISPLGLALSPDERTLYVTCGASGRLTAVDLDRRTIDLVGINQKPAPISLVGVAVDGDGNIYASDRLGGAVFVYSPKRIFLRKIGEGMLERPTALAIDRRAQLLYVISGATRQETEHRVEVFALSGKHLRTLGKRGDQPGEFNFPSAVAVAPDGSLYVADMLNFRVQKFDREGTLVSMFGENGTGKMGVFDKLKGIGFDTFGNVYVVDSMQGVQIFNAANQPLLTFGAPPFMNVPGAILLDSKNHIFVTDFGLNQVHEFQLINTTAADSTLPQSDTPAKASAPGVAPGQSDDAKPATLSPATPADKPSASPTIPVDQSAASTLAAPVK